MRHTTRKKKHLSHGLRTPEEDFATLKISEHLLEETEDCKKFIIFDDVVTSGHSLLVSGFYLQKSQYFKTNKKLSYYTLMKNQSDYSND